MIYCTYKNEMCNLVRFKTCLFLWPRFQHSWQNNRRISCPYKQNNFYNPFIQVTGCLCVCIEASPKLLKRFGFPLQRPRKGSLLSWGKVTPTPAFQKGIYRFWKKNLNFFYFFFLKLKCRSPSPLTFFKCP